MSILPSAPAFEALGQDFLVWGSGTKAAAATPLCQMNENPKATAKGFTFHQDKACRGGKWADLGKHRCEMPVLPCRATRAELDGHQSGVGDRTGHGDVLGAVSPCELALFPVPGQPSQSWSHQ